MLRGRRSAPSLRRSRLSSTALPLWRRLAYGLGPAGLGLGGAPLHLLLLYYLTETLGLRAGLAGLAVGLPKIWDLLIDPALGGWVDRLALRQGRRAPLALAAGLAYVGTLYLLFSLPPGWSTAATLAAVIVLLIVSSVAHTAFHVTQMALADELAAQPAERAALLATSGMLTVLLTLAGTAGAPMLIRSFGGGSAGYSAMAAVVALAAAASFALFYRAMRDCPAGRAGHAEPPLWPALRATLGNRSFYQLMAYLALFGIAAGVISAFLPFANRYILRGGEQSLAVLGSIVLAMSIAALPLAALAARRLGTLRSLRLGNAVLLAAFPLLFLASYGPLWTSWAAVALFGLGAGAIAMLLQSASIGIAKLPLAGGGLAPLGVYLGILIAGQKLGQSLGGMVAGALLDAVGFVGGAATQAPATLLALRLGYTWVPLGLCLLGTLWLHRLRDSRLD